MSPRKTILRELSQTRNEGGSPTFTRPASIAGFSEKPAEFQKAVNDLLKDRLIEGQTDEEGRMTIALNTHRMGDVDKVLRPVWARPSLWLAASVILVALMGLVGA